MAEIELLHGETVLLDQADLALVQPYRWHVASNGRGQQYAIAHARRADGRRTTVSMHRLILGLADPSVHVDHRNGNGLDNRRENLRRCNHGENMRNSRKPANNTSGYKGVYWHGGSGKWRARIRANGPQRDLGSFTTAAEAHAAYCRAADELHGDFKNYGGSV